MSFFPDNSVEEWSTYGSLAVIFFLGGLLISSFYPAPLNWFNPDNDYDVKLVEWERDRIISLAKGVAGTSITFLLALAPIVLKQNFIDSVSPFTVIGIVAGFLGALLLACDMSIATSEFTRSPTAVSRNRNPLIVIGPPGQRRRNWWNQDNPDDVPPEWPSR